MDRTKCKVEGCENLGGDSAGVSLQGFCQRHYREWRKSPEAPPPLWTLSREERFWKKVARLESDSCWLWTAAIAKKTGYGVFQEATRRTNSAHRVAYELLVGPIPINATLDHLCRNRACVNPAHLEPVSRGENTLRGETITGENQRKAKCKWGHEFSQANTAYYWRNGTKRRRCRQCSARRTRAYNARLRGAAR